MALPASNSAVLGELAALGFAVDPVEKIREVRDGKGTREWRVKAPCEAPWSLPFYSRKDTEIIRKYQISELSERFSFFFCRSARPGLWRSAWPRRLCTICILCSRFCSKFCSSSKLIGITSAVLEIPKLPKITVPYPVGETRKKIEGNPRKEQGHHHIDIICGIRVYDLLGSSYSSRIEELDRIKSN